MYILSSVGSTLVRKAQSLIIIIIIIIVRILWNCVNHLRISLDSEKMNVISIVHPLAYIFKLLSFRSEICVLCLFFCMHILMDVLLQNSALGLVLFCFYSP